MLERSVTFVTTTSYGSWLPGDVRGYVQNSEILPASPSLERHARRILRRQPVLFSEVAQAMLSSALLAACDEFAYRLFDLSIESWHAHWIVRHEDAVDAMVGRLKNRMRQRLNRGRIWTRGYCHRALLTEEDLIIARKYIRRHSGCRLIDGKPSDPGHLSAVGNGGVCARVKNPPAKPGAESESA